LSGAPVVVAALNRGFDGLADAGNAHFLDCF
jgi:hypothetical protein